MMLNREIAIVMIEPLLISYSFRLDPEPVPLDVTAIAPDGILLLDSYFTIVIFHGITITLWRKAGYQDQEGHEVFAHLLCAPKEEANSVVKERFPPPCLVVCDQYGSQICLLIRNLLTGTLGSKLQQVLLKGWNTFMTRHNHQLYTKTSSHSDDFHPKLSDFVLDKLGHVGDKSHVSTRVMETYGYCAPEYAMTGQLTVKSDVYNFGVVLLELVTGRKAIDSTRPPGETNLLSWAEAPKDG